MKRRSQATPNNSTTTGSITNNHNNNTNVIIQTTPSINNNNMSRNQFDEEQPLIGGISDGSTSCYQSAANNDDSSPLGDNSKICVSSETTTAAEGEPSSSSSSSSSSQGNKTITSRITRGHALLFVVAILYGSLNVTLRGVYGMPDPPSASALSTVRGWLAVICFLPFMMMNQKNNNKSTSSSSTTTTTTTTGLWWVAAELAFWNACTQALQNIALLYIQSARVAFLSQLSVVMTPCLSAILGRRVQSNVWYACVFALVGLIFMSKTNNNNDDNGGDDHPTSSSSSSPQFALSLGDIFCLCSALSWSTYLFRLSAVGDRYDDIQLQSIKTFFLAIFYSLWCSVEYIVSGGDHSPWIGWNSNYVAWILLFYSALGPGTVADVIQQKGQSTVSATVANIILSLEPVFTAIFGRILLGELIGGTDKIGGSLILMAALVATMRE